MYRGTYTLRPTFGFGRPWTPMVRILILSCAGVFLLQLLSRGQVTRLFSLDTGYPFHLWRYVSYLFLHGGVFHLLLNMFALWIFGSDLEEYFGSRRFLRYYLFTGVGAGFCVTLSDLLLGQHSPPVIGASGAVFGLLLAYGIVYAERVITLLIFFVLPLSMKAKHFVILFGALEFLFLVTGAQRGISNLAHLGGMAFGYLYLRSPRRPTAPARPGGVRSFLEGLRRRKDDWDDKKMDDLLRKVNDEGIQSLSASEKAFLQRMSRRKRWH